MGGGLGLDDALRPARQCRLIRRRATAAEFVDVETLEQLLVASDDEAARAGDAIQRIEQLIARAHGEGKHRQRLREIVREALLRLAGEDFRER